jgi:hypothetical protein
MPAAAKGDRTATPHSNPTQTARHLHLSTTYAVVYSYTLLQQVLIAIISTGPLVLGC